MPLAWSAVRDGNIPLRPSDESWPTLVAVSTPIALFVVERALIVSPDSPLSCVPLSLLKSASTVSLDAELSVAAVNPDS